MIADLINGLFELFGGFAVLLSIAKLYKDKQAKGVSEWHIAFFTSWGLWNIYYYPSLGQLLSFYGGIVVVIANAVYVTLICYYNNKAKRDT